MRGRWALVIVPLFVVACAQVKEITGGDKDTTPPTLVSTRPPNGSVNFTSSVIRLDFNERIQLDRVREKLLISPPLDEPPSVRIIGSRSVEIGLKAALKPNTTYSFNLGECVKDLSEGNFAAGSNYVISTGAALDSLRITGVVINAYSGTPEKDVLVVMHAEGDTGMFRSGRPMFMARSGANGAFTVDHLPEGRFALFAIKDKNGNFRYDLPNEEVAFLDSTCVLSSTDTIVPHCELRIFLPASAAQQIRTYSVLPDGALQLVLARSGETLRIKDVARTGGSLTWKEEWNQRRDTVLLWPSDTTLLSEGSYELAQNGVVLDTLRYRAMRRMPFNLGVTSALVERGGEAYIRIRSARPIGKIDSTRFRLDKDSLSLAFSIARDPVDDRTLLLRAPIRPGTSAQLTLLPKALRDIYGGTNDTLRIPLGRAGEDATGTLRVNISGTDSAANYVLQLLDGQQRVIREASITGSSPNAHWVRLSPGKCTLRLIADRNSNGHWDTGEWGTLKQPEKTWYHAEPVNVRAAWDVVLDWVLE